MTVRPCPHCMTPTFRQPDQHDYTRIEFYSCRVCGHAWSINRERARSIEIVSHSELRPKST